MRGLLSCLILISQVKDCFGVFSAGSLGPTKHKLFVCQCKLKALFISSNPCSFQLWGVQVCIYMSTKMLWLWLDLIGVIQSFGTVFCNVPRLVTVESESLDSQCDSALSHRSPSHLFFLSSRALGAFSSSYSVFGGTRSPAWASHGKKERWHNQNQEQHCCFDLKCLARQQRRRLKGWKKKKHYMHSSASIFS